MNRETKVIIKLISASILLSAVQAFAFAVPAHAWRKDQVDCRLLGETDPSKVFPPSFEPLVNDRVDNDNITIASGNNSWSANVNDSSTYLSQRLVLMQEQFKTFPFPKGYNISIDPCYKKFMRAYTKAAKKQKSALKSEYEAKNCSEERNGLTINQKDSAANQMHPSQWSQNKTLCENIAWEYGKLSSTDNRKLGDAEEGEPDTDNLKLNSAVPTN